MGTNPGQAALNYAMLRAAADVADHWVQTDCQARRKGIHVGDTIELEGLSEPFRAEEGHQRMGQQACAAHVASYVGLQGAALVAGAAVTGRRLHPGWLAAGLALSAVTHYAADRRRPLKRLAELVPGKIGFYNLADNGLNGAYLLDQAFHHGVEAVAALVSAVGSTER